MKKATHKKLTKWLNIISLAIFVLLFLWTLYSPAMLTAREGTFNADFAVTIFEYFLIIFGVLALNFVLRLFKK